MKPLMLLTATLAALSLDACSGSGTTDATPRPVAYPRLTVADSVYRQVSAGGVTLQVNTAAIDSLTTPRDAGADNASTWLNILYPTYDNSSVIYTTITPVTAATRDAVIENRLERIALNLGGTDSQVLEMTTPAGWECRLITAASPIVTPLQFIAFNNSRVVTGAYYISNPGDSVAPYVNAVERDIIHLLKTLQ